MKYAIDKEKLEEVKRFLDSDSDIDWPRVRTLSTILKCLVPLEEECECKTTGWAASVPCRCQTPQQEKMPSVCKTCGQFLWAVNDYDCACTKVQQLEQQLTTAKAALERLSSFFEVAECDCGESWSNSDGATIVRAALKELEEDNL